MWFRILGTLCHSGGTQSVSCHILHIHTYLFAFWIHIFPHCRKNVPSTFKSCFNRNLTSQASFQYFLKYRRLVIMTTVKSSITISWIVSEQDRGLFIKIRGLRNKFSKKYLSLKAYESSLGNCNYCTWGTPSSIDASTIFDRSWTREPAAITWQLTKSAKNRREYLAESHRQPLRDSLKLRTMYSTN